MMIYKLLLPRGCVIYIVRGSNYRLNRDMRYVVKIAGARLGELKASLRLIRVHSTFQELIPWIYRETEFGFGNAYVASRWVQEIGSVNSSLLRRYTVDYGRLFEARHVYHSDQLAEIIQKTTGVQSLEVLSISLDHRRGWNHTNLRRARQILVSLPWLKKVFSKTRGFGLRFVAEDIVAEEDVRIARQR